MHLSELIRNHDFLMSIEVFPPKTEAGDQALFDTLDCLMKYRPAFVSCTYGAGGSTRDRTMGLCKQITSKYSVPTTSHLTCVGSTRDELRHTLNLAKESGVTNIMALRGDPPQGSSSFVAVAGGLSYAIDLVKMITEEFPELGVGVAAYPEAHPEAVSSELDLKYFIEKMQAGADAAFTQLFFENDYYFNFVKKCQVAGVTQPIVPGIMPITEYARIKRIAGLCKSYIPVELCSKLESAKDDLTAQFEIGVDFAIQQCRELIDKGVPGIHFYALNKSQACERILDELELSSVHST